MTEPIRDRVLRALRECGELHPEQRFGQMFANLVTLTKNPTSRAEWAEAVWDVEDEALLAAVTEHIARQRPASGSGQSRGTVGQFPDAIPLEEGERNPNTLYSTWIELVRMVEEFGDQHFAPSSRSVASPWEADDETLLAALKTYLDRRVSRSTHAPDAEAGIPDPPSGHPASSRS